MQGASIHNTQFLHLFLLLYFLMKSKGIPYLAFFFFFFQKPCKLLPWWLRGQSICLQCGRPGFDPWVWKIPWRRKWQSTPVFLPGDSHGWRSLVGYSPQGRKELDTTERLHFHFPTDGVGGALLVFLLQEVLGHSSLHYKMPSHQKELR